MTGKSDDRSRTLPEMMRTAEGRKKIVDAMKERIAAGRPNYVRCPVCGVAAQDLRRHAEAMGGDHSVLEVMES